MTESIVVFTELTDSSAAGTSLGSQIAQSLNDEPADAVILFASTVYEYPELLSALDAACHPKVLVGGSSAGEFTNAIQGEGLACAVALRSADMEFSASVGRGLTRSRAAAAKAVVAGFRGPASNPWPHRYALILTDAMAGHVEEFVEELTAATSGMYQFFGGGVGGDAQFRRTHVFCGTQAIPDAVVALEILSNKPFGIGVAHGWKPASPPMRVTEAQDTRLISLNAVPAVECFEEHAAATGQKFDRSDALPFFLHNILGIEAEGGAKLRVPLSVNPDGSISCATEVPAGATVHIMTTTSASAVDAAQQAMSAALTQLGNRRPSVALMFDCVATRLRMGKDFALEIDSVKRALDGAKLAGCNSIGQIARAQGQFSGFHNCTAVVCSIPE